MSEQAVPRWSKGDRLRKARLFAHLEQDDIADELGVTRQAVSRWENDAPIKRAFVKVWANRCGVPFDWLWEDEEPPDDGPNIAGSINRDCMQDWFASSA